MRALFTPLAALSLSACEEPTGSSGGTTVTVTVEKPAKKPQFTFVGKFDIKGERYHIIRDEENGCEYINALNDGFAVREGVEGCGAKTRTPEEPNYISTD